MGSHAEPVDLKKRCVILPNAYANIEVMATATLSEFRNEAYTDFSQPANRQAMEVALKKVRSELGREYPLRIGGEMIATGDKLISVNPSKTSEVVGVHHKATAQLATARRGKRLRLLPAMEPHARRRARPHAAGRGPHPAPPQVRVRRLAGLRSRQDVARSRSRNRRSHRFLRILRARNGASLAGRSRWCNCPASSDEMIYIPLGVGVVIPPWNFPLAILAGMTVASLVTGNTVIIKPSSETPTIAAKFAEVLLEAGFPEGSFTLLTGSGAAVGDVLVQHPKTRFVSFTGSRDVGLRINELAAKTAARPDLDQARDRRNGRQGRHHRGWRCDLDKAVDGVLASAFGYQGQKCSACSRAIVDAKGLRRVPGEAGRQGEDAHRRACPTIRRTTWAR